MAIVSKEDLLKARIGIQTFEIEGLGEFRYRGLTLGESEALEGKKTGVADLLAMAVVEPKLSRTDWQEVADAVPANLLTPLAERIAAASGMKATDAKEAYVRFRDESGS